MNILATFSLCVFGILVSFGASVVDFKTQAFTRFGQLENNLKIILFYTALGLFATTLYFWLNFDPLTPNQLKWVWVAGTVSFGLDGLSLVLFLLTSFVSVLVFLVNWNVSKNFFSFLNIFVLELFVLLAFSTTDIFLFFLAFEGTLIPMLALLGIFGSRSRRVYAMYSLFLYTIVSSFFLLIALFTVLSETGSTTIAMLEYAVIGSAKQNFLWVCFFIAFATKLPLVPFHLWLPEAHVEAPTAGSILLAALLLKLGGYGFIRFMVVPLHEANYYFAPLVSALGLSSLVFASLSALRQTDLKRIIAYSSIAHMSVAFLGLFSGHPLGIQGGVLMFLSHGITSTALFFMAGIIYSRFHTRNLWYFGGIATKMPLAAVFFFIFMGANCSVPGTFNFIAELFVFVGIFQTTPLVAVLGSTTLIFSAAYSVGTFNKIFFGSTDANTVLDLTRRETYLLTVLATLTVVFGIAPWLFLNLIPFVA